MNSPAIRFAGFTDAWEQRKFGEMYRKVNEKNDMTFGLDRVISVANMYFKRDGYVTDLEYLKTYNVFKLGDIAFEGNRSKNFAHGRFVENTIGDGIVSHVFIVFRPTMKFDLWFWKYAINNERLMGAVLTRSTKSSTMMTDLVVDDFLKNYFLVPCFDEQREIGKFFVELDRLITLHQREHDKTVNIKKALLEKMFPKDGEDKPEIRFAGFTGAWEQRELGDVATVSSGYMGDSLLNDGKYKLTRIETISDGFVDLSKVGFTNSQPNASYRLNKGDILYSNINSLSHIGKVAIYHGNLPLYHGINLLRVAVHESQNPAFLFYQLNTGSKKKWANAHANKAVSQASINQSLLAQQQIQLCEIEEQSRIGVFFSNIDRLIALHQRELTKLQNIKKALLEKMFV